MFCEKCQPKFDDFWAYLMDEAATKDEFWLEDWFDEAKDKYPSLPRCACGSRKRREERIQSKTGNYCLEVRTICADCKQLLSVKDLRDIIRQNLEAGFVYVKDKAILEAEVGKE